MLKKEVSQYLYNTYRQDEQIVRNYLHSLPQSKYMLGWKKRLCLLFGETEDVAKLDEWDWSTEEIFRASFAIMSLREWDETPRSVSLVSFKRIPTQVKLSDLLKIYFAWYIKDCKGCETKEDYKLYDKDESDFVNRLRDTYYQIRKTVWEEKTYLTGHLVFGDPPAEANKWKRIIAASEILRLLWEREEAIIIMPYKLIRDV